MLWTLLLYLIALIILYLLLIIFSPVFPEPRQPIESTNKEFMAETSLENRHQVSFSVDGLKIKAWLYLPDNIEQPVPCIVLNNGFGGTKDMVLERYALRFNKAGFAALSYDYRYFGESGGKPRHLYSTNKQIEDLWAAVEYLKTRKEIDKKNIAIWGTSAAGGYGIIAAAKNKDIKCIIGQCPGLDNDSDQKSVFEREGFLFFLKLLIHAQRDKGRSRFNLSAHTIPIVGMPHTTAIHTAPGAFQGYNEIATDNFINEVCARLILIRHPNPIDYTDKLDCPALFQICEKDEFISAEAYKKAEKILGNKAIFAKYPIGHFDIYQGKYFEQAIKEQIDFLKEHLN